MLEAALVMITGVWAGAITTIAWERIPVWRRLDPVPRAVDFRRSLHRMDPTMPILAIAILVLGVVFALRHEGIARALAWIALGGITLIVVGSVLLLEPINTKFRRLPEGTPPPDAASLHTRWTWLHLVRTVLAVASLGLFVTATLS
ncbi:hypothetical protein DMB66_19245 [Actinoplanes sp. ATCC 53533]|uniref:DUF1772 domain-containing protein n=2 Tax=Actinoplanes sp. ATCC 53533 TaxID=1288362 RepID=UPI000F7A6023|nr:DUF1772 domain-containing protein [Actinoplanes sp. ATCC 53533]RSM64774.1 hypothetical protein DMB66_19245 [Actinoplanes sp. ATCC 53533]